jgi:hypothetical protein
MELQESGIEADYVVLSFAYFSPELTTSHSASAIVTPAEIQFASTTVFLSSESGD